MSPSTKSKPASPSSPATGAESSDAKTADRATKPVEVDLEVSKQRWIAWTFGGIIGGTLLVLKLGTVGVWGGYVLIALGLWRGYQLAMSMMHPPGKFIVSPKQVTLPRGVHRPKPLVLEPSAITAVYFLRRSVPWNRSSPLVVIELGDKAMVYPRDWFASEAEQRHLVEALLRLLPDVRLAPEPKEKAAPVVAES